MGFETFADNHIPCRQMDISQFGRKTEAEYDFFVTGSDQVWNPYFRNAVEKIKNQFLAFAPPHQKVCFAPSIGVNEISKQLYEIKESLHKVSDKNRFYIPENKS